MLRHGHPGRQDNPGRLIQLEGKDEETTLTFSPCTLDPYLATHRFHQLLAYIQPQPGTAHRTIHITLKSHKTLEETLLVLWQHA